MDIRPLDIANYYYKFIIQSSLNDLSFSTKEGKLDLKTIDQENINKLNYFHLQKDERIDQKVEDNFSLIMKLIDLVKEKKGEDEYKIVFFPFTYKFIKKSGDRQDPYITSPIYFIFNINENIEEVMDNLLRLSLDYALDDEIEIFKGVQLSFNNLFAHHSIGAIDPERVKFFYDYLEKGEFDREYPIKNFNFYKNILAEYLNITSSGSLEDIISIFHGVIQNKHRYYMDEIESEVSYKSTIALVESESLIEADKINGGLLKAYKNSILPFLQENPKTDDKLARVFFKHESRHLPNSKALFGKIKENSFDFDFIKSIELQKQQLGSFNSKFPLTLSQRYAINAYLSPLEIIPVNGPPGTGKTALLRAIFSNYIVENAFAAKDSYDGLKNDPYKLIDTGKPILGTSSVRQAINNIIEGISGGFSDEKKSGLFSERWLQLPNYPVKTPVDLISNNIVVPQLRNSENRYDSSTNILYTSLETIYAYIADLYAPDNVVAIEHNYIENAKQVLNMSNDANLDDIIDILDEKMQHLRTAIHDKIDDFSVNYSRQYDKLQQFYKWRLIDGPSLEAYNQKKNILTQLKNHVNKYENILKDDSLIINVEKCEKEYNTSSELSKLGYEQQSTDMKLLKNSFTEEYFNSMKTVFNNLNSQILPQVNDLIDEYNLLRKELIEVGFFRKIINKLTGREKKLKKAIIEYEQEGLYSALSNQTIKLLDIEINRNIVYAKYHNDIPQNIANKYFSLVQNDITNWSDEISTYLENIFKKIRSSSELLMPVKEATLLVYNPSHFLQISHKEQYQKDIEKELNKLTTLHEQEKNSNQERLAQNIVKIIDKYELTDLCKNLEFHNIQDGSMSKITIEVQKQLKPYKDMINDAMNLGFETFIQDLEKEKNYLEKVFEDLDKKERFKLFFYSLHMLEGLFVVNLKRLNQIHHTSELRCPLCNDELSESGGSFNCVNQKSKKIGDKWDNDVGTCKFKLWKKSKYSYKNLNEKIEFALDVETRSDLFDLLKNRFKQNSKVYGIKFYAGGYHIAESSHSNNINLLSNKLKNLHILTPLFPMLTVTMHSLFGSFSIGKKNEKKLTKNFFDLTLSDESGMILSPVALPALYNTKRMVIVGDEKQIEPVYPFDKKIDRKIIKTISDELDYDLFHGRYSAINNNFIKVANQSTHIDYPEIKSHEGQALWLKEHFRCKDEIIDYCNEIVYKGILIPKVRENAKEKLLYLDNDENVKSLMIFDVESIVNNNTSENEALKIVKVLKNNIETFTEIYNSYHSDQDHSFTKIDVNEFYKHIGIVTPFNNQKNMIKKHLPNENNLNEILVGTVHAFQGSEREIIIFSPAIDKSCNYTHFANSDDGNMMNVAVSRAKSAFWVFGSCQGMKNAGEYTKELVSYIEQHGKII